MPFALLELPKARPKERCLCHSSTDTRNVHDVSKIRGSARSPIEQNMAQGFFKGREVNSDEAVALGAIVRTNVQKDVSSFSMGTDPSIQTKRSLLDVTQFKELETAGGVMTKLIERQTCATQADNQAGFSKRFLLTRRGWPYWMHE